MKDSSVSSQNQQDDNNKKSQMKLKRIISYHLDIIRNTSGIGRLYEGKFNEHIHK
jgi:hypothetical protein